MQKIIHLEAVVDEKRSVSLDIVKSLETVFMMLMFWEEGNGSCFSKQIYKLDAVKELWIDETGDKTVRLVNNWMSELERTVYPVGSWYVRFEGWSPEDFFEYKWRHVYEERKDIRLALTDDTFGTLLVYVHLFVNRESQFVDERMVSYEIEGTIDLADFRASGMFYRTEENRETWYKELRDGVIRLVNIYYGKCAESKGVEVPYVKKIDEVMGVNGWTNCYP